MQKNYIHNKVKVKVKDREVHLPDYLREHRSRECGISRAHTTLWGQNALRGLGTQSVASGTAFLTSKTNVFN